MEVSRDVRERVEQEQACINIKLLCDYIKTEILKIDNFPNRKHYYRELKKLKEIADKTYWKL